jgi:hypothetical protein
MQSLRRKTGFSVLLGLCVVLMGCDSKSDNLHKADGPRFDSSRGLIGAYYYPWYWKSRWTEQPVTDTPKLEHYSSDDKAVVRQHIQWARQADLDFFIVSWLSEEGKEGQNLKRTFLPEIEKSDLRFALFYESSLALQMPAGKKIDLKRMLPNATTAGHTMIEHFDHFASTYFKHPNYLCIDGRPVVIVYIVRDMTNAAPYFALLRQRMQKKGINLYLVADVLYWDSPETFDKTLLKAHFEGVTAYNMYRVGEGSQSNFLSLVARQFTQADTWARSIGLRLIPNVMPGYDDTRLRGHPRPILNRHEGKYYRDYWRMASQFVDDRQRMFFVTSFNEWHEGTEIEPSVEYGDAYLGLSRDLGASLRVKVSKSTNRAVPPQIIQGTKTP